MTENYDLCSVVFCFFCGSKKKFLAQKVTVCASPVEQDWQKVEEGFVLLPPPPKKNLCPSLILYVLYLPD